MGLGIVLLLLLAVWFAVTSIKKNGGQCSGSCEHCAHRCSRQESDKH